MLTDAQKNQILQVLQEYMEAWDAMNKKHLKIFVAAEVIPFGANRAEKILREEVTDFFDLYAIFQTMYLALIYKMGIEATVVLANLEEAKAEVLHVAALRLKLSKDLVSQKNDTFHKTYPTVTLDAAFRNQVQIILSKDLTVEVLIGHFLDGLPL
jgi:hypothetical protein